MLSASGPFTAVLQEPGGFAFLSYACGDVEHISIAEVHADASECCEQQFPVDHKCSKESDFPDAISNQKVTRQKDANQSTLDFFYNCDSNPGSLNCAIVMVQKAQVSCSFQALSIPNMYMVPSYGLCVTVVVAEKQGWVMLVDRGCVCVWV